MNVIHFIMLRNAVLIPVNAGICQCGLFTCLDPTNDSINKSISENVNTMPMLDSRQQQSAFQSAH